MNPHEYSAVYFNRAAEILFSRDTQVTMQVFQKNHAILCGVNEVVELLKPEVGPTEIWALRDGDEITPWEPVMILKGDLADFVSFESMYLGILARSTKVATNARKVVDAANGKPVFFFADRFDRFENQRADGYAATIGGVTAVCTEAMAKGARQAQVLMGKFDANPRPVGTMPHALIAAYGGDVVAASRAFMGTFPDVPLTALVDFNNDCVGDSLRCLETFGKDLYAVRLDTSEKLMDKTIENFMGDVAAGNDVYGVNPILVTMVRRALDAHGGQHVKICVSGGFSDEKIARFEKDGVPVDIYAVGSSLLKGSNDFTADVVEPVAKVGRELKDGSRLIRRI
jgi:nicotinate phosphoribosyltransferase